MDHVLIDGDQVMFMPTFGPAVVVVQPGRLRASGKATLNGKKLCIVGDESSVSVPGCMYMTPQYVIPGVGTLEIKALADNQKSRDVFDGGTQLMLVGQLFDARFKVDAPAKQPPPGPGSPIDDATKQYEGKGRFITTNVKLRSQ
jgi:hypothetical protein